MRRAIVTSISFTLLCLFVLPASAQRHDAAVLADGFVSAWNAHNPQALESVFSEDADWVTVTGLRLAGREKIQSFLAQEHGSWAKATQISANNVTVREVSADVAVLYFDWEITGAVDRQGQAAVFRGVNVFVARNGSTGWRVVAGQATNARPAS